MQLLNAAFLLEYGFVQVRPSVRTSCGAHCESHLRMESRGWNGKTHVGLGIKFDPPSSVAHKLTDSY